MSGRLLVLDPEVPDGPHLRVRFAFTDHGKELRFVDQRTFGGLSVAAGGGALGEDERQADLPEPRHHLPGSIAHIAADPLDEAFDDEGFVRAVRSRHTGVKRALLDQSLISGVGNIYADEALWRAQTHWARPTATMTRPQVRTVLAAVREVLAEAVEAGGTSFDSLYVDVNGQSGYFDRSLNVYGREGEPCYRCGTPIRRDKWMNRSAYTCPHCQPRPRRPHL